MGWGEAQALWPVPTCCPARALPVPGHLAAQGGGLVFLGASVLGGGGASWTGGVPERVLSAGMTFPLRRSTGVFTNLSEPSTGMRARESPPQMRQPAPFLQKGLLVPGSVAPKPRPCWGPAGCGEGAESLAHLSYLAKAAAYAGMGLWYAPAGAAPCAPYPCSEGLRTPGALPRVHPTLQQLPS